MSKGKNKVIIKNISYILVQMIQFLILGYSFMIYTSLNKKLPWHEGSGMQFLIILVICIPALLVIAVLLLCLQKIYKLRKINKIIPFCGALGIGLPILIDGSLSTTMTTIGTVFCIAFMLMVIITTIIQLREMQL